MIGKPSPWPLRKFATTEESFWRSLRKFAPTEKPFWRPLRKSATIKKSFWRPLQKSATTEKSLRKPPRKFTTTPKPLRKPSRKSAATVGRFRRRWHPFKTGHSRPLGMEVGFDTGLIQGRKIGLLGNFPKVPQGVWTISANRPTPGRCSRSTQLAPRHLFGRPRRREQQSQPHRRGQSTAKSGRL